MKNDEWRPAVEDLKQSLRCEYGDALESVIVFGSVARGAADAASDIDVMVVVKFPAAGVDWRLERDVRGVALPVELAHDVVFDLHVMSAHDQAGAHSRTPFTERVLAEGVSV